MPDPRGAYIPALKYSWLTALYDPLIRWTTRETTFKHRLVQQAGIAPGQRVLDLGCGTGTLTLLTKQTYPAVTVVGLDGDPAVLRIAQAKVAAAGLAVTLDQGLAVALPYPDRSFDRVLSSLVFHHLTRAQKRRALGEVFRVLRPGGELHIADWGPAHNGLLRLAFLGVQLLDGFTTTTDNVRGRLPALIRQAGLSAVQERTRYPTLWGMLTLYSARKPRIMAECPARPGGKRFPS